jgi:polysaccharide pyruvyl transferase CsaB
MFDIIISGYYGFKNSGDDAILTAVINNLREYKEDVRVLVLSANPKETRQIYGVDAINRFNAFKVISAMKKARLFINGGGSLIQDITSTRSLFYYLGTIWLARKMGLKVMVYANGIGPVSRKINKKLTQKIVNNVDVITLREETSKKELEELGILKPKVLVTADPALTIEPEDDARVDTILHSEDVDISRPLVGFSMRDWKGSEKYIQIIADTADYIAERYNVAPVFIPMHYPRDIEIIEKIIPLMKNRAFIIKNKYTASEIIGIINRMELLIGMRLHSLIYAAVTGIPVIGLAYEPKIEGFLKYTQQVSAGHINDLQLDKLISIVDDVWEKRGMIKNTLQVRAEELKEKAVENAKIAIELLE